MTRHRRLLADQRGFTMVSVMLSMMVVGLFAVGAWQAAVGDIPIARGDQDRKRAYEAAEAGLQWYGFQLQRDPAYWSKCTAVPAIAAGVPAPVNQEWKTGTDTRLWRTLLASDEQYAIELLPATGQTQCSTATPSQSMIESGTMRIRSTGRANGDKRSLVATYRRRSFVDFIYFTQWETLDPLAYSPTASFDPTDAANNCDDPRSVRKVQSASRCTEIQFVTGDAIKGPLHTNDESLLTCGSPVFGRTGDRIEIAGPMPGNVEACTSTPSWTGTRWAPAPTLSMPPSNSQLAGLADAANGYKFTGNTCLKFNGTTIDYWSGAQATSPSWNSTVAGGAVPCSGPKTGTKAWPPPNGNKVIYVANGAGCTASYSYRQTYNNSTACGDVMVSGTYGVDVTIGAENDIIVQDDVLKTGDNMLGLIANNFVRVYHPATMSSGSCGSGSGSNDARMLGNLEIDAAILALNHSFIVDNWGCGTAQGTLKVVGAIAQKFRGPVGTGAGTTGYFKDYNYDDRLRYKEPPNFLDPVQTQWNLMRRSEQQPAR